MLDKTKGEKYPLNCVNQPPFLLIPLELFLTVRKKRAFSLFFSTGCFKPIPLCLRSENFSMFRRLRPSLFTLFSFGAIFRAQRVKNQNGEQYPY